MKKLLRSLLPEKLAQLRERVASAVGNDWLVIDNVTFIERYAQYCQDYRIGVSDVLSSYPFLKSE